MNRTTISFLIAALAIHVGSPATAGPPGFMGLGQFPGVGNNVSIATGVSGDGSTVVGYALDGSGYEAFKWTAGGGFTSTGVPARAPTSVIKLITNGPTPAVSWDGSTIAGGNMLTDQAFRWTEGGGEQPLGDLTAGSLSTATGVSGDGSVVVGFDESDTGTREAFRWTESTGMVGLGSIPGGSDDSQANEISADGSTIVGVSDPTTEFHAFRWTTDEGMVALEDYSGNITSSSAFDVSPDGKFIVGHAGIDGQVQPFRWTEAEGMVALGNVPGGSASDVGFGYGVSGNGSVVVGMYLQPSVLQAVAFYWDAEHGTRVLQDVLTNEYGLDLAGWELTAAYDVSTDGNTIVGFGVNPNGDTEAWIAVVPEPSTFVLAGSGLFALAVCMWRKRSSH